MNENNWGFKKKAKKTKRVLQTLGVFFLPTYHSSIMPNHYESFFPSTSFSLKTTRSLNKTCL